jgi:predicted transcriptional regulator
MQKKNTAILKAMLDKGLNLASLSKAANINISTLSRKINGLITFREPEMYRISVVLEKEPSKLFFNYELPNGQQKGA